MFSMFKKKSELEKLIDKNGLDHVVNGFTEVISQKLTTVEIAYQFVLEELEAASFGSDMSKAYASKSGISERMYKGSLDNSRPEVDGPDGPQQTVIRLCMQLMSNTELMVDFRLKILDKIMREYEFGMYKASAGDAETTISNSEYSRFSSIAEHVFELSKDNLQTVGMALKLGQGENLVKSCAEQIQDEIFQTYDTKVVAMVVMQSVAMNGLEFKEVNSSCMLALSVVWASIKMKEEGYALTDKEKECVSILEKEARALLENNYQSVNVTAAKLWIGATLVRPITS